jgi:hypothetical protein
MPSSQKDEGYILNNYYPTVTSKPPGFAGSHVWPSGFVQVKNKPQQNAA